MVAVFDSPLSFAYHVGKDLLINGVDIYHDVDTAVTDYKNQNWDDFGYHVGHAAAKAFLGDESQIYFADMHKEQVGLVFEGILEAFGGKFNLENLLLCIYEEDQAALMLDIAV